MWNTGVIVVRENAPHYFYVTNLTESFLALLSLAGTLSSK
jgi:hypothetical protein